MKTQKRRGVDGANDNVTIRLNVRINAESAKRLGVHVAMTRRGIGAIIEDLIDTHLRDFSMPAPLVNRGKKVVSVENHDREIPADHASESTPLAA